MIAYYRVSTERQGRSGLGLEAQQAAVESYSRQAGDVIRASFTEVETGKRSDRPELLKALGAARRGKERLVVAKLDRLARNARFLLTVLESGADVVFCDLPHVPPGPTGKMLISQMAAIAEWEAGIIAQRTREALAASKARGKKLGAAREGFWTPERSARRAQGLVAATAASSKARRKAAIDAYADLLPLMVQLRGEELSLAKIAERLNAEGHMTRRGKLWHAMQVKNVLDRGVNP